MAVLCLQAIISNTVFYMFIMLKLHLWLIDIKNKHILLTMRAVKDVFNLYSTFGVWIVFFSSSKISTPFLVNLNPQLLQKYSLSPFVFTLKAELIYGDIWKVRNLLLPFIFMTGWRSLLTHILYFIVFVNMYHSTQFSIFS